MLKNISKTTIGTLVLTAASAFLFGAQELEKYSPLSVGVEVFQAFAQEDAFKLGEYKIGKTDLTGVNVKVSYALPYKLADAFEPEIYGSVGIASGDDEQSYSYDGYSESYDTDITMIQMMVGANLRYRFTEHCSVYGGVKLGIGHIDASCDYDSTDNDRATYGNSDLGINYGLGVGIDFSVAENHAITIGLDYLASTARPKIYSYGESLKMKEQSYGIISIGYRYNF